MVLPYDFSKKKKSNLKRKKNRKEGTLQHLGNFVENEGGEISLKLSSDPKCKTFAYKLFTKKKRS